MHFKLAPKKKLKSHGLVPCAKHLLPGVLNQLVSHLQVLVYHHVGCVLLVVQYQGHLARSVLILGN